ncbi:hypothetical protein ACHAXS_012054 [Conticribra weissflogii]
MASTMSLRRPGGVLLSLLFLQHAPPTDSFAPSSETFLPSPNRRHPHRQHHAIILQMAKTKSKNSKKNKKQSSSSSPSAGLKGFGSASPSSSSSSSSSSNTASSQSGTVDRSKAALAFYDYLSRHGAASNLKRVGLGRFPLPPALGPDHDDDDHDEDNDAPSLRGVIALRDVPKGEPLVEIPYEMAVDLGRENADPTLPALTLLQKYCSWRCSALTDREIAKGLPDYFAVLPPHLSDDCLGSTDFFSDGALDAMQSPLVAEETRRRRESVLARYERDVAPMAEMSSNLYRWNDHGRNDGDDRGTSWPIVDESHLRWATWLVTSRVLTVRGPLDSSASHRLLIPLVDMCNHDRDSPHVLTGRAAPGAMLKVLAGRDVKKGEPVDIAYGGGVEGNDRFLQDYGFLDSGGSLERKNGANEGESFVPEAYRIVARKLLGKEKGRAVARLSERDRERALEALRATSLEEDEALMKTSGRKNMKNDERMALEYRIGVKKALKELMAS